MIAWEHRSAENWATLFGFVRVPLFGQQRSADAGGRHVVLLDGRRSSLTFSLGIAAALLTSKAPLRWAWSANVPRSIIVDEPTGDAFAVRWDRPSDVRQVPTQSPEQAAGVLAEMELPPEPQVDTSVSRAIGVFRSVRQDVRDFGGTDVDATRAFTVLLLLADSLRRGEATWGDRELVDVVNRLGQKARRLVGPEAFAGSVASLPVRDLAADLLSERGGLSLDPYLLIRHASGTLFQEAHIQLNAPPAPEPKLFVSLRNGLPKPAGRARADAHYTPTPLARFLTERAVAEFKRLNPGAQSIRALDPACGSGVFLVEALREMEGSGLSAEIVGIDASPISKLMADFSLASAAEDFVAAGGRATVTVDVDNSLSRASWGEPDVILMNPPFVPWRSMEAHDRQQVRRALGSLYHGHADTAIAFLAKAVRELKPRAVLAAVMPAAFLQTDAAGPLRRLLSGPGWNLRIIGRVRDYGYFSEAVVEPAFVVLSRSPDAPKPVLTMLAESDATDSAIRAARVTPVGSRRRGEGWELGSVDAVDRHDWSPRPRQATELLSRITAKPGVVTATDLFTIRLGIRTGDNSVFVVQRKFLSRATQTERSFFKPVANDITDAQLESRSYVFYPYENGRLALPSEDALRAAVPLFYATRLEPNRDHLAARLSLRARQWWELVEPRIDWPFGVARIVTKTFGRRGAFALDAAGRYAIQQGHGWLWNRGRAPTAVWLAYLALLNSPPFEAMLDHFCMRTRGGQYELAPKFLRSVPLPDLTQAKPRELTQLTAFGKAMRAGDRVPLRSLSEAASAVYGVSMIEFAENMPLLPETRLEIEFHELASRWKRETSGLSLTAQRMKHPAMTRILAMGPAAVPHILRDLKGRPTWWFAALSALTGVDPIPPQSRGALRESAEAWIAWGAANGVKA